MIAKVSYRAAIVSAGSRRLGCGCPKLQTGESIVKKFLGHRPEMLREAGDSDVFDAPSNLDTAAPSSSMLVCGTHYLPTISWQLHRWAS